MAILKRRPNGSVKDLTAFTIRITPELKKRVENFALRKEQGFSMTVEQLLEQALGEKST